VPFFVEAEIFMHNVASTNPKNMLLILYTNTTDQWKRYLPILLDPMHLADEFPTLQMLITYIIKFKETLSSLLSV